MRHAELVVDASAVMRGLTTDGPAAVTLDRIAAGATAAYSPDLVVAEVSNALVLAVRTGRFSLQSAQLLLGSMLGSSIELYPSTALAASAVEHATATGLSAYDSFYAVLAAELDVPLLTADRRLAEAVPGSVLVA